MSLTIQQIIMDAKRLAGKLKERDTIADTLLNETNAITQKIDAMKQFQEEVDQLNDVANQKPHSQLIEDIQKENRHLREIQQENRELRSALEDYHSTLEHIMTKYRQHTSEQIYRTRVDFANSGSKRCGEIIDEQAEKIAEMAAVMKAAALFDEGDGYHLDMITMLQVENKGLREMLGIAMKQGSVNSKEDKTIQTETENFI